MNCVVMHSNSELPSASGEGVRRRMRSTRRRDTAAELALRRELHACGLRYRVDRAVLPGSRRRADIVFPRERVAVFVDVCFWHSCPIHSTKPKANAAWWAAKLAANVARDRDTDRQMREAGWVVVRGWEHEDPKVMAVRVRWSVLRRRVVLSRPRRRQGSDAEDRSR